MEVKGKIHQPPNRRRPACQRHAPRSRHAVRRRRGRDGGRRRKLQTLLDRNGFYRKTIEPIVVRDEQHQQVSITFQVDAGKRARFTLPNVIGDTKIPAANVARAAKYKEILFLPWKLATQANLDNGVQNIRDTYEKQDRLTASVTLDHTDYLSAENRVRPTILADGGPKIKINAEGAKVSKKILKRYVPVFDEGTVNEDLLVAGARNLRDYFQNRGYFDVEVEFASSHANKDLDVVTYTVSLGGIHRVVSLDVKGNRYFRTPLIRERMFLQPKGKIRLRHGRYSQIFATRDGQAIEALYRDSGFRDCQVSTRTIENYRGKQGDVAITIAIEEGPQYLVSDLAIDGMTLENKDAILASLASSTGQPYSETSVAMDRDAILEAYGLAGYPNAAFDYRATPAGPASLRPALHHHRRRATDGARRPGFRPAYFAPTHGGSAVFAATRRTSFVE